MKKSLLHDIEIMHGAKMIDVKGIIIPKVFSTEKIELNAIKTKSVMYDLSDKMKILISGKDSWDFISSISNDNINFEYGKINKKSVLIDKRDISIKLFCLGKAKLLISVDIENYLKLINFLLEKKMSLNVSVSNLNDKIIEIALIGNLSFEILKCQKLLNSDIDNNTFLENSEGFIIYHEEDLGPTYGLIGSKSYINILYKGLSSLSNVLLGGYDSYHFLTSQCLKNNLKIELKNSNNK